MYAIKGNSYRIIATAGEAAPDETVSATLPPALLAAIANEEAADIANAATLRQRADQALTDLRTFRDLASPTNAQTVAIVKVLCRVAIGLIRLQLRKLDGTD